MLLTFGAVLSIICGSLMAIYTWTLLLQRIVVVRSFLRMIKLRKLAVCKLYLSRWCRTRCQGVLDYGLNLHRNIPLSDNKLVFTLLYSPMPLNLFCYCINWLISSNDWYLTWIQGFRKDTISLILSITCLTVATD